MDQKTFETGAAIRASVLGQEYEVFAEHKA